MIKQNAKKDIKGAAAAAAEEDDEDEEDDDEVLYSTSNWSVANKLTANINHISNGF